MTWSQRGPRCCGGGPGLSTRSRLLVHQVRQGGQPPGLATRGHNLERSLPQAPGLVGRHSGPEPWIARAMTSALHCTSLTSVCHTHPSLLPAGFAKRALQVRARSDGGCWSSSPLIGSGSRDWPEIKTDWSTFTSQSDERCSFEIFRLALVR